MQQEIYADLLFLINFSMDYLCIYICAKVLKRRTRLSRMLIASVIGGVYSIVSLFLSASMPISVAIDIFLCLTICAIAFYDKERGLGPYFLCSFLYLGISMMMGGCMTAIFNLLNRIDLPLDSIEGDGVSVYLFAALALIAGIISLKSGNLISRQAPIKECVLTISLSGSEATVLGFADSGNFVKDPISNKAVIIVNKEKLQNLVDIPSVEGFSQGKSPPKELQGKLRLIPIKTASGSSMLTAFSPDTIKAELSNRRGKAVTFSLDALIAPADIGQSALGYDAIIPSEILKI